MGKMYCSFIISKGRYLEEEIKKLEEINNVFNNMGLRIEISGEENNVLTFAYDEEKFKKVSCRNAGRHKKYLKDYVSVDEIRERMKSESAEEVAASLGVSRSTLFRKLKRAAVNEFDEII